MIQAVTAAHGGLVFYRTAGRARRKARMGLYGLIAVAAIAGSGALVSGVQARMALEANASPASQQMTPPGPFSYFPR